MKHKLFDIWKGQDNKWKIQMAKGRMSFNLKREATEFLKGFKETLKRRNKHGKTQTI